MWTFVLFADKRTQDYFLVESPLKIIALVFGYLYFCNRLGPRIMQNRKPLDLRNVMIVYNVIQIAVNAFLFIEVSFSNHLELSRTFVGKTLLSVFSL